MGGTARCQIWQSFARIVWQPDSAICPDCSCYIAWKTKVHTRCRDCHLCINVPMWREERWLQEIFDPLVVWDNMQSQDTLQLFPDCTSQKHFQRPQWGCPNRYWECNQEIVFWPSSFTRGDYESFTRSSRLRLPWAWSFGP